MSATLIAAYVAQMHAVVVGDEKTGKRVENWETVHSKLVDMALLTAERMRVVEHAKPVDPDLFAERPHAD